MVEELQVVQAAVSEINEFSRSTHNIVLQTIKSETDLLPGVGGDAQSVINSQILNVYDIYLGLLGVRFGTPTRRAGIWN
jgi:hypothetical protein